MKDPKQYFAHSLKNKDKSEWEPLFTPFGDGVEECQGKDCEKCENLEPKHGHLNKVAYMTAYFVSNMFFAKQQQDNGFDWGYITGLWHDLGKFSAEFQDYISNVNDSHTSEVLGKVDHTSAGARLSISKHPLFGNLISTAIAGHHSGLLDAYSEHACLKKRLVKSIAEINAPDEVLDYNLPSLPSFIEPQTAHFSIAFFQRMLFSCLVDADFLATESFMNTEQASLRPLNGEEVFPRALELLEKKITSFGDPSGEVNIARKVVYDDCITAALHDRGIFSLTVPTGGGKTLSSLAFALKHAIKNGHKKIIYVIPFTSIIEQNASVFHQLLKSLGKNVVLEHHSNLSPDKETTQTRLAAENWDAPIIVTTTVQFYESLFANKTSKSRKLHNIANSVVILDEAQSLPVQYLTPCLRALEELSLNYGTTTVLCTATQPAINKSEIFPIGLDDVKEIISDTRSLFSSLERTKTEYRNELSDEILTGEIAAEEQCLCIVNTRNHAQGLFKALPESEENFHLSALMTPNHRIRILDKVRSRLDAGLPTRLISTQLIEAGVDIDFPVVYRSMAGLDSISQAAGRCNRNGKIEQGRVFVFHSEHTSSERYFQETANVGHQILDLHADDPLSTQAIKAYFNLYYYQQKQKWDSKAIMAEFKVVPDKDLPFLFQYRSVAEKFKLIENNQISVIIPNDSVSKELVEQLRNESIPLHRKLLRSLQRYSVQIYENQFAANHHQFKILRDGEFNILICPETHYSEDFGLNLSDEAANSNSLIC
jgi:CRISPR-associated endonuclease/helicase Cas3